jgi:hypothetical protein
LTNNNEDVITLSELSRASCLFNLLQSLLEYKKSDDHGNLELHTAKVENWEVTEIDNKAFTVKNIQ